MIPMKKLCVSISNFYLTVLCCFVPHLQGQSLRVLSENLTEEKSVEIYVNQVAYDKEGPKSAVIGSTKMLTDDTPFTIVNVFTSKKVYNGKINKPNSLEDWFPGTFYYRIEFSKFTQSGKFRIEVSVKDHLFSSPDFSIEKYGLATMTIPSVIHYFHKQRANTEPELKADAHLKLYGSEKFVDLHGGWCDASGDVSKYFSHLAYANFMSPQQIPLVTWSMVQTSEVIPHLLTSLGMADSIKDEAIWGADYLMRALSDDNYFYMIVFSYFNKNPDARRVVGLLANSVTTSDYQCAFREGGGMAIAALARISGWKHNGDFTSQQYLKGAKRAFSHLLANNTKYDDDGKENIIDDYCALLAATELWIATDSSLYRDEARKRVLNLSQRISSQGYFISNDTNRPFWHASDAGMPIVALARYLNKETDPDHRILALSTLKKALDYELTVTNKVANPFGYARQNFLFRGKINEGFFIPHENETGWWWQGENARLSSLAAAALIGGRFVYSGKNSWGVTDSIAHFTMDQISWILGCNPYSMCFMYQFGKNNVPYMSSNFGHGSQKGGISNGITGKDGNDDGSGIDFKINAKGNEWRWTEQWLPHAAWYLLAISAMAEPYE